MGTRMRVVLLGLLVGLAASPPAEASGDEALRTLGRPPSKLGVALPDPSRPAFAIPELEVRAPLRMLDPGALGAMRRPEADGPGDRWVGSLGPRWLWFAAGVADGMATRYVLEPRGVHVLAPRRGGALLYSRELDPATAGIQYFVSPLP